MDYNYRSVKKYPHGLQLCTKCQDVILDLSSSALSFLRR